MDDKHEVVQLNLNDIIPNRFQPREVFDEKALKELAVSIKEHGIIQPIIVRQVNGKYEIIAGERRYKASALAGMTKIPAIVRDLDDKESSKVALLENLQRKNLNPIEEARTYQKILELDEMTQEELAKTMGKSQSAVANKIRLLSLPDDIQNALLKEQISERHARTLLNVDNEEEQKKLLNEIIETKMTVRVLEEKIKELKGEITKPEENQNSKEEVNSINNYLNTNPINPNVSMPEETKIGTVTVAPPEGEEENYQVKDLSNKSENDSSLDQLLNVESNNEQEPLPVVHEVVEDSSSKEENTTTPNVPEENNSQDLDNLLNSNSVNGNNNSNFITNAEKIVKTDSEESNEKIEDYFKSSDFDMIQVPTTEQAPQEKKDLSLQDGIDKIKELTNTLKDGGLKVSADEMNFDSSYQVIIKIEKE